MQDRMNQWGKLLFLVCEQARAACRYGHPDPINSGTVFAVIKRSYGTTLESFPEVSWYYYP